jgi:pimeloyl-ACP methyl ester carboxylesterase
MDRPDKSRRRRRRQIVYGAMFLTYALTMLFGGCASKLILFPSHQPIDAGTARRLLIPTGPDRVVETWVDRSPGASRGTEPQAYVIEFTGNATRAEQVASFAAARWGRRPIEAWMVNFPGYGGSTGPADLAAIPPAALAVYDHVARLANGRPIFLAGNSLGTTAALYTAANRPTAGLVLQNPPALRNLILTRFGWWNLWLLAAPVALQIPKELDSPTNAAKVTVPAVFTLAHDDTLVVTENQLKTVDAYAGPKRVIHYSGGHNDGISGEAGRELDAGFDWLLAPR